VTITFLGHSGFAVDTGRHVLLFDYAPRRRREEADALLKDVLQGRSPLVFVSHVHADHFTQDIYDLEGARFFVGEGVPAQKQAAVLRGGDVLETPEQTIRTYPSTDEGVAFLVEIDGFRIFHAGDLNWWHWPGEPDPWNPDMAQLFRAYTAPLLQEPIDLAFLCADPRQHEGWLLGFDHLMRNGKIARAVPMHFWNQSSAPQKVCSAPEAAPYRSRIIPLARLGDTAEI